MKPLCEQVVHEVLPGVRAVIAKKLMDDHGFSQVQVAKLMGTTQPAISHYRRQLRGRKVSRLTENPDIIRLISEYSSRLASGEIKHSEHGSEFCRICMVMQENGLNGSCPALSFGKT